MDDYCTLSTTEAVSAVYRRREIILLVTGIPTLTSDVSPSKMIDILALRCQPSSARLFIRSGHPLLPATQFGTE
jgi:hypothetical protein